MVRISLIEENFAWYGPTLAAEWRKARNLRIVELRELKPERKSLEPRMEDIALIREHTERLFVAFVAALSDSQKAGLLNPLAHKFRNFKTL